MRNKKRKSKKETAWGEGGKARLGRYKPLGPARFFVQRLVLLPNTLESLGEGGNTWVKEFGVQAGTITYGEKCMKELTERWLPNMLGVEVGTCVNSMITKLFVGPRQEPAPSSRTG